MKRNELIILAVVIVALAAYVMLRHRGEVHYELPRLKPVAAEKLDRITIEKGDRTVTLNRTDDNWIIQSTGYRADKTKVEKMLNSLADLTITALAGAEGGLSRYQLDEDDRITVRAWAGDELLRDIRIGKTAASYRHTFVQLPDDDRVYHGSGNLRSSFDTDAAGLRSKRILAFDRTAVTRVDLVMGDSHLEMVRGTAQVDPNDTAAKPVAWTDGDGKELDATRIDSLLNDLETMQCSTFLDVNDAAVKEDPALVITINDGQDHRLSLFSPEDKEKDDWPASSTICETPFTIPKWKAEQLTKDFASYYPQPGAKK